MGWGEKATQRATMARWVSLGRRRRGGGEGGDQGGGRPTQRVVGLVGGLLEPGTSWGGAKGHPTSPKTHWVPLRLEMVGWGVKRAGRGWESPPNASNDSLGAGRGRGVAGWGKGPPNESLDSLGAVEAGDGGVGGEVGRQGVGQPSQRVK